jgi:glycerol-1-phosphatase
VALSPLLQGYDQVILDLDGCVWVGDDPTPRSQEAIAALRQGGKAVAFATNNSWVPGEEHVARLWKLGIQASLADVVTVGGAMQHLLAETRTGRSVFVIGTQAMVEHAAGAGLQVLNGTDRARDAEVVVISGTDRFTYEDLKTAVLAVRAGADLLATGRDPTMPTPEGHWPGTGALVAAVETASERKAAIVGKPEPQLFITAVDRLGEGRTLVVGDRLDADVAAAAAAGLDAALVLTGGVSRKEGEAAQDPRPVAIAENLAELVGV